MKILLTLFGIYFSNQCGYGEAKGREIEQKLDDCYKEHVKDSRLKMAVGFEICFGFNNKKLNDTVAELINHQKEVIKETVI